MADTELTRRVAAVRHFNRYYTRKVGALDGRLLASEFSLTEVRVLYELSHRETAVASEVGAALGLDPGYLSRIVDAFARRGLLTKRRAHDDARRRPLALTARGHKTFAALDARSRDHVAGLLGRLPPNAQARLVEAMRTVESILDPAASRVPFLLRGPRPGDLGWVVHRHGALYAAEYGWDGRFEALAARIVARFVDRFDPARDVCWLAEREGEVVGCVFVVGATKSTAKLRLLLVEPSARGLGIGARLVDEALGFARRAHYRKIKLWTNSILSAARRLYEKAGFRLVDEAPHQSFGHALVGQTWERVL